MKKLNSKFNSYLAIVLAIVGFVLSWQFTIPKLSDNKAALAQATAETNALSERMESLKTAQTNLNSLGSLVDQTLVAVPEGVDLPNLITELEAISVKHQTFLPSIQVGEETESSDGNSVAIAFGVTSDYNNLINFMKTIEKSARYMNIKSITISGDGNKMTLGLQMQAFKRQTKAAALDTAGSPETAE